VSVVLKRRPYPYATSAPLEEIEVRLDDGRRLLLIAKDLDPEHLLGDAAAAKRRMAPEPRREISTYESILAPAAIGPRLFASSADDHLLILEKVPGVELWQVEEPSVWEGVAAWLARFHARFAGETEALRERNRHLLDYDAHWFTAWRRRALAALARSDHVRARALRAALGGSEGLANELAALPRAFVHGEFYPSNILVAPGSEPAAVWPVDWETAGIGPGLLDLAALASGFDRHRRRALIEAYARARGEPVSERALAFCSLQLALQLIGRASDWSPPAEHAHDWIGEALDACGRLGLA
jgi:Ser/Thr protein kinase RdoA (MazF antagonist)